MGVTKRKTALAVAKVLLGIGVIAFIAIKIRDQNPAEHLREALQHWPWLACGFSLFLFCLLSIALRWFLLLRAQEIHVTYRRVLQLTFIGHFFNAFMLGGTGGDLVKAYYAAKETETKKTEAVTTVFVDRVFGLIMLFVLTNTMMAVRFDLFMSTPAMRLVFIWLTLVSLALYGMLVISLGHNIVERWSFVSTVLQRFPRIGSIITRVYEAFYLYRRRPAVLAQAALLSIINHVVLVLIAIAMGKSLAVMIPKSDYFSLIPIGNLLGGLPITPGGIGVREGAYSFLLPVAGVLQAHAFIISLAVTLSMTVWSLIGGLFFAFYSASGGHSISEELSDLRKAEDSPNDAE